MYNYSSKKTKYKNIKMAIPKLFLLFGLVFQLRRAVAVFIKRVFCPVHVQGFALVINYIRPVHAIIKFGMASGFFADS